MPLVVTEDCQIYWNYQVWSLPKGTAIPEGEFANYLRSAGGAPVDDTDDEPPADPTVPGDDWTVAQVLAWVGDDSGRAAVALDAEEARARPRSTLVDDLRRRTGQQ